MNFNNIFINGYHNNRFQEDTLRNMKFYILVGKMIKVMIVKVTQEQTALCVDVQSSLNVIETTHRIWEFVNRGIEYKSKEPYKILVWPQLEHYVCFWVPH